MGAFRHHCAVFNRQRINLFDSFVCAHDRDLRFKSLGSMVDPSSRLQRMVTGDLMLNLPAKRLFRTGGGLPVRPFRLESAENPIQGQPGVV